LSSQLSVVSVQPSGLSRQLPAFGPPTVRDLLESWPLEASFTAQVFGDR
jgi:hypothetical protein